MVLQLDNGKYLHTAYAISNIAEELGTDDWSLTDQEGMLYIGTYIDGNSVDSTDPTAYNWEELVDEDVDDEDSEGIMPVADFQSQIDALADQIGIQQSTTEELQESVQQNEQNLSSSTELADNAQRIAGNTNQYFWHTESGTDTGAHITKIPQKEFLEDPENGGGNLLARSNGIAVRDGLEELGTFSADGIVVGKSEKKHVAITDDAVNFVDNNGNLIVDIKNVVDDEDSTIYIQRDAWYKEKGVPNDVFSAGTYSYTLSRSVDEIVEVWSLSYGSLAVGNYYYRPIKITDNTGVVTWSFDSSTNKITYTVPSNAYCSGFRVRYTTPDVTASLKIGDGGTFGSYLLHLVGDVENSDALTVDARGTSHFGGTMWVHNSIHADNVSCNNVYTGSIGATGGIASLVNTGSTGATFKTTTETGTVRIRGGDQTDSHPTVTIAHTLSGYYPIALIGYEFTGSHATWLNVYKVALGSQSVGSCNAIIGVRDFTDGTSYVTPTIYTTVLWAKSI